MNMTRGSFSSFRLLLVGLNLAVLLTTVVIIGIAAYLQRENAVEYGRRSVATMAAALKQHSALLLRATDQGLAAIASRLADSEDFRNAALSLLSLENVLAVELLAADGSVLASIGQSLGENELSDNGAAKQNRTSHWPIGVPVRLVDADGSTNWAIPVRHPLVDGRWLVAMISLSELEAFYGSLDLPANSAVGLVRRDGRLLARIPITELGRDVSGSDMVSRVVAGEQQSSVVSVSAIDHITRIAAFDAIGGFPAVAYVAIDSDVIAVLWGRSAVSLLAAGVMLLVVIASLSVGVDYSFRRRRVAERQLAETRNVVTAVLDAAADGLLAINTTGEVLASNPAASRMLGISPRDLSGRSVFALLPAICHPALAANGGERRVETSLPGCEEKPVPVSVVVTNAEGDLRVVTLHDRTEELEHTAKVAVLEKMRMVGQLTGGVAHDFNNILTIISLNLEMLGTLIADSPLWEQYAVPALRAAKRGASLTSHLLAFARRQPLAPEIIDPNAVLRDVKSLLGRSLGERWQIDAYTNDEVWPLLADAAQLETALVNLAINARDAMPDGGRIVLEARNVSIDEDYANKVGELQPGNYVIIAVTDEGTGMSEDVLARAFEPFFTTKPVGKGSGLGLSMVFGFAKQSNGHVTIYSELGRGTTVKLYLPRALSRAEEEAQKVREGVELPCLRVFVVEDDNDVRATAVRALRSEGMVTIEAHSAEEALDMVHRGVDFDLLFTDVVLPKMSGRQLADILLSERPGLRVLYSSGYTENAIIHHGRLDPGVVLLSKPYTHAALRTALAHVIARPTTS